EHVRANDVKAVRIDWLAGANDVFPPTGLAGNRVSARGVLVGGQRMANEDGIRLYRVEFAVSLVGNRERCQVLLTSQPQRRASVEMHDRARRLVHLGMSPRGRGFEIRRYDGHRLSRRPAVKSLAAC